MNVGNSCYSLAHATQGIQLSTTNHTGEGIPEKIPEANVKSQPEHPHLASGKQVRGEKCKMGQEHPGDNGMGDKWKTRAQNRETMVPGGKLKTCTQSIFLVFWESQNTKKKWFCQLSRKMENAKSTFPGMW